VKQYMWSTGLHYLPISTPRTHVGFAVGLVVGTFVTSVGVAVGTGVGGEAVSLKHLSLQLAAPASDSSKESQIVESIAVGNFCTPVKLQV
jgi:hypothetical protein